MAMQNELVGDGWTKVALQVNPYAYLVNHQSDLLSEPWAKDEATFNENMVAAAKDAGVRVIALTDHFACTTSESLRLAMEDAGIAVLPNTEQVPSCADSHCQRKR